MFRIINLRFLLIKLAKSWFIAGNYEDMPVSLPSTIAPSFRHAFNKTVIIISFAVNRSGMNTMKGEYVFPRLIQQILNWKGITCLTSLSAIRNLFAQSFAGKPQPAVCGTVKFLLILQRIQWTIRDLAYQISVGLHVALGKAAVSQVWNFILSSKFRKRTHKFVFVRTLRISLNHMD